MGRIQLRKIEKNEKNKSNFQTFQSIIFCFKLEGTLGKVFVRKSLFCWEPTVVKTVQPMCRAIEMAA